MKFHLLISKEFGVGSPIIATEIKKRGHKLSIFEDHRIGSMQRLLWCDVLMDMSAITDVTFYHKLGKALESLRLAGKMTPITVDPPSAIITALDKNLTHELFGDLIPKSYVLDGKTNRSIINTFSDDEYVIVKSKIGWEGRGVERMTPLAAIKKYEHIAGKIIQKYVPASEGVGRIVTLNWDNDFEVACSYLRVPKVWKAGLSSEYTCKVGPLSRSLYDFAKDISVRCGLYLNGIDYILYKGRFYLLEVNAVPAIKEPSDLLHMNVAGTIVDHIEKSVMRRPSIS